ncbi:phosphatase PAP2 family protein [Gallaecimonas kandeliae]|uniref:phosphatase PAP2 family protein n=1 Tax=Gallaecimonas kandeliae TaxID=3029055 RepID=UPI00264701C9|nr:phosphatase PAP2 family protein [Gallaecimonas kandeliae]WKE65174.1 phosphatase PAP2 family protein [Gallaecimonas kandeliae]
MKYKVGLALLLSCYMGAASAKTTTEKLGDVLQLAVPAAAFAGTAFYEDGYDGMMQLGESAVTSEVATLALKNTVRRRRPNGHCCDSFPSGHTSIAFMGAAFIQKRYGWEYALPAYLAASYVGYSRVLADKHYTSDVVAGAVVGTLSSFYFTKPYEVAGAQVTPVVGAGYYGFNISKRW